MKAGQPVPFPFPDASAPGLPPEVTRLRAGEPVARVILPTGDQAWIVTRYQDVKAVLADRRLSRSAAEAPGAPRLGNSSPGPDTILGMDPPRHTRIRRLAAQAFTPRQVERLRPRVRDVAEGLVQAIREAGPPADLVASYCRAIPRTIIFELLGVPREDCDLLHSWTDVIFTISAHSPAEVGRCRSSLEGYMRELIAERRRRPADDLITGLVAARDEHDSLSEDELISFGFILMTVGHESTAGQLASAVLNLLLHPAELARLSAEPSLLGPAVEELLRFNPYVLTGAQLRVAVADVDIAGTTIRSGEAVIAALSAANHDPAVFSSADDLVLDRPVNQHLAFGFGVHHCLGAALARLELTIALGVLISGLPGLRLAVGWDELAWKTGPAARRLAALPATWPVPPPAWPARPPAG